MFAIFATVAFDVIENFDEVTRLVDAGDVGFFIVKLEDKLLGVSPGRFNNKARFAEAIFIGFFWLDFNNLSKLSVWLAFHFFTIVRF